MAQSRTTCDGYGLAEGAREYVLTSKGTRALAGLRRQVEELHREVVQDATLKRG